MSVGMTATPTTVNDMAERQKRFALAVRRALLLIVRFIEAEYGIGDHPAKN